MSRAAPPSPCSSHGRENRLQGSKCMCQRPFGKSRHTEQPSGAMAAMLDCAIVEVGACRKLAADGVGRAEEDDAAAPASTRRAASALGS